MWPVLAILTCNVLLLCALVIPRAKGPDSARDGFSKREVSGSVGPSPFVQEYVGSQVFKSSRTASRSHDGLGRFCLKVCCDINSVDPASLERAQPLSPRTCLHVPAKRKYKANTP